MAKKDVKYFVDEILNWYEDNGRDFPWRKELVSPYEVLVSEIFLQKTHSKSVEKVFSSFTKSFPDFSSLRNSKKEEVKEEISPLGLHERRSAYLVEIAKKIDEDLEGELPRTKDELKNLPGVGEYVADAVLSFAFGKETVVLDVNVKRILKRFFGNKDPKKVKESIEGKYEGSFKELNYALIDFGGLVCSSKPNCKKCPLRSRCNHSSNPSAP